MITKKHRWDDHEIVPLTETCNSIISRKIPAKLKDPGSFTIPCIIGPSEFPRCLCDLGASINLLSLSVFRNLGLGDVKPTNMSLQLADHSIKKPYGVIEDVLVKVDKFIFPVDFVVLDFETDRTCPLILGRPFLNNGKALIDVHDGKLTLRVGDEKADFFMSKLMKYPLEDETCMKIVTIDECVKEVNFSLGESNDDKQKDMELESEKEEEQTFIKPKLLVRSDNPTPPSIERPPRLKLKPLPSHLRYAFLSNNNTLPIIISNTLTIEQEKRVCKVVKGRVRALGW